MARCETPPPVERLEFSMSPPPPPRRKSLCVHIVHGHFDLPDLYTLKDNDQASNMNNVTPISLKPRVLIPSSIPEDIPSFLPFMSYLPTLSSNSMNTDAKTKSSLGPRFRPLPFKYSQVTPSRKRTKMNHVVAEGGKDSNVPLQAICKPTPIRVVARSA